MTIVGRDTTDRPSAAGRARLLPRTFVGVFYVWTSGIHVGIVAAGAEFYRPFAQGALFPWVRDGWREVFMAAPHVWGLGLAAGEMVLGLLLLRGGRWARVGWTGVITFQVALVLFGWGFLLWSGPALVLLVWAAARDWQRLGGPQRPAPARPRPR